MAKLISRILILFVRLYQYTISPILGANCRYSPTCSGYAVEAIEIHGPLKGTYFTIKRILSCHPWGGHGYDPVPKKEIDEKN
jgi:putative membrane protein insertion efficiency factor